MATSIARPRVTSRAAWGWAVALVVLGTSVTVPASAVAAMGTRPFPRSGAASPALATAPDAPLSVTPYSGYNPLLARAPYVTDLAQTSAYITWATTSQTVGSVQVKPAANGTCPTSTAQWSSSAITAPTALPGPVHLSGTASSASMTGRAYSVVNGSGTSTTEYQNSVRIPNLTPGTGYCYAVFSTGASGAVNLLPTGKPYQQFSTLDTASTSSTRAVTFDVLGDTGENLAYSTAARTLAYPNYLNPHQAALYKQIGQSNARFALMAGDISYSGGTQSTYGDLTHTGKAPEVSNIFGPSYLPQAGGIPVYAADGNHGQNVTTLRVWPTHDTALASNGTYALDTYGTGIDGLSGSVPDNWYAFSTGNVRVYVLDASWSDSNLGTTTGSLCPTPSYCRAYQADADVHWRTTSPEYTWLAQDLAAHAGGVKFAVTHFPLRSDNATQPSDLYLQNSTANPKAATSLEKLLSAGGVSMVFSGHAHTYQRISPNRPGQLTTYVTGGGGGVLEPVLGGTTCKALLQNEDIYALGWTPSSTSTSGGSGSYCGPAVNQGSAAITAATPQSAADVYHFLKVTVVGTKITVTPTDAAGKTFDQHTYTATG